MIVKQSFRAVAVRIALIQPVFASPARVSGFLSVATSLQLYPNSQRLLGLFFQHWPSTEIILAVFGAFEPAATNVLSPHIAALLWHTSSSDDTAAGKLSCCDLRREFSCRKLLSCVCRCCTRASRAVTCAFVVSEHTNFHSIHRGYLGLEVRNFSF